MNVTQSSEYPIKTAVIAGVTGLVGSNLLSLLLADNQYSVIHTPGRRDSGIKDKRVVYHQCDFNDFDTLPRQGVDEVYCALGTTIGKAGSQQAFRAVDFDAVVNLARWSAQAGVKRFVVISSLGANAGSRNFYQRTKGQMEQTLKQLGLNSLIIVRPSLLIGSRKEVRRAEKIGEVVMKVINPLLCGGLRKYRSILASDVAIAMKELAQSKFGDLYVIESDQLQVIANGVKDSK